MTEANGSELLIADTNCLMNVEQVGLLKSYLDKGSELIVPLCCVQELDRHNHGNDENRKYRARVGLRFLRENEDRIRFDNSTGVLKGLEEGKVDNIVITIAKLEGAKLLTLDLTMRLIARNFGIECINVEEKGIHSYQEYKGYIEVTMDEMEMATFYECMANHWGLLENQYLIIKDISGEVVDKYKWTKKGFVNCKSKTIDSKYVGKVSPRNLQQELYVDMLQDKNIKVKVVEGSYGTGKDYLALANFLHMIDKGMFNKIVWIRNNIEADGTKPIGYLPGSLTEKLSVFADIVGDFVGDNIGFEMLMKSGKLELVHTGFLRGRDLRNSIIYCTESQNMSESLVKLVLSRVSENSIAFFNGDVKQADEGMLKRYNGLSLLKDKLKGNELFGYVMLDKCERGEVAQLASLLD